MKICELIDLNVLEPGNELPITGEDESSDKIYDFIKTNCSDYLAICKKAGGMLYRGFDSKGGLFNYFIGQPRDNRESLGLSGNQHDILIKCFQLVGFKATRNQTISCASNKKLAGSYGRLYAIFPINGFSFTWSTKYKDIGGMNVYDSAVDFLQNVTVEDIYPEYAARIVKKLKFTDKNLVAAIKSGHEVAIYGKYIAIAAELVHFDNGVFIEQPKKLWYE